MGCNCSVTIAKCGRKQHPRIYRRIKALFRELQLLLCNNEHFSILYTYIFLLPVCVGVTKVSIQTFSRGTLLTQNLFCSTTSNLKYSSNVANLTIMVAYSYHTCMVFSRCILFAINNTQKSKFLLLQSKLFGHMKLTGKYFSYP